MSGLMATVDRAMVATMQSTGRGNSMIFTVKLTNRRTGNTKVTEKHGINEAMLRHALEGAWPGYDIEIRQAKEKAACPGHEWHGYTTYCDGSCQHGPVAA